MWQAIVPYLLQSGALGMVAWVFLALHRSAIRSESRRADAWERIAMLREQQMGILLGGQQVMQRDGVGPVL